MKTLNFEEAMTLNPTVSVMRQDTNYIKMADGTWWKEEGLEEDVTIADWDPMADQENVRYTLVEDKALTARLNAIK